MSAISKSDAARWWNWLLLGPFIGVLWVPFYNRVHPELWGIPFFFWYQFLWVPISALLTGLVYLKTRPPRKISTSSKEDSPAVTTNGGGQR